MSEERTSYNAADAEQVAKREKKKRLRELKREAGLKKLMETGDGRAWMWDLLSSCGVFHSSFASDGLVMAFNEGRRDIGLRLVAEINRMVPELYGRMVVENQE